MAAERPPIAITWLGHATVLLELDGTSLLTDPVLRNRIGPLVRLGPRPPRDLGRLSAVLLSHLHADHVDLKSLRAVARGVPVLAPTAAGEWLRRQGLSDVRELAPGAAERIERVLVRATPASHDGRRRPLGPAAAAIGYLAAGSSSVYFAGDTDLFPEMEALRGTVTVALLPVWGWGPSLGPGHLDPRRAATAAALIEPAVAIPIHWGTFALGRPASRPSDPARPAREFATLAERLAPTVEVRLLAPGERTTV